MIGSLLVGALLVLLGGVCVVVGLALAVTKRSQGAGAFGLGDITNFLKALAEALKALAALPAATQLVVLGLLLIAGGAWLLDARPF